MLKADERRPGSSEGKSPFWTTPAMVVAISAIGLSVSVTIFAAFRGIELKVLVRDPAATYKYPSYIGFFSHIGVILMISTASLTGFAAWMAHRMSRAHAATLATTAALSMVLAIDDIFMFHESASRLGEVLIFLVFACLGAGLWIKLRQSVTDYDLRGLFIALFFLGLSVVTDIFKVHGPFSYWLEDFSKLAGFAAWLTFWAGFAGHTLSRTQ